MRGTHKVFDDTHERLSAMIWEVRRIKSNLGDLRRRLLEKPKARRRKAKVAA